MPDSCYWTVIHDIDFCIQNYKTKRFLFIELKTRWNKLTQQQREFYTMINRRLISSNSIKDWRTYIWTHLLEFEKDNFDDWYVLLDWKMINEYQLQFKLKELLF